MGHVIYNVDSVTDNVATNLVTRTGRPYIKIEDFCKRAGIKKSMYYKYLSGEMTPNLRTAVKICNCLGITLDELVKG